VKTLMGAPKQLVKGMPEITKTSKNFKKKKRNMQSNPREGKLRRKLTGVWFGCFLFSFSLKTKNGDENVFGLISKNIFSENENRKQLENENNKFSFSVFC